MNEINPFIRTFRQEADEILSQIESAILDLEQNPADKEQVHHLFRGIHTIKGSGAMFGLEELSNFTHQVESILAQVRDNVIPVTPELINLILASKDVIQAMLDSEQGLSPVSQEVKEKIIAGLHMLRPGTVSSSSSLGNQEETEPKETLPDSAEATLIGKKPELVYRIRFRPDPEIMKTGMEPMLLLNEVRGLGESTVIAHTEQVPLLDQLDTELCYLFWEILLTTFYDVNAIKDVFIFVEENSILSIDEVVKTFSDRETPIVPRLSEILVERGDINPKEANRILEPFHTKIGESFVESGKVSADKIKAALLEQKILQKHKGKAEGGVRVSSDKLDKLVNLVGELVITQAHLNQIFLSQTGSDELEQTDLIHLTRLMNLCSKPLESLERLTGELRDCALKMRMVPVGSIFSKFRRMVHDLSAEFNKSIELITEGADTELDKNIIERLNDPLMHLIRNSIDHGIQKPEIRLQHGKPPQGVIRLSAFHRGANVMIVVEDDGQGVDLEAVRAKAVEKGLMTCDQGLSEQELYNLLFMPGFSTAASVTTVSGRGVGLDVVKREIDAIGGSVHVSSQKGKYTRITLSLPLTLAIIDGLMVEAGEHRFVLPLTQIEECMELTKKLLEPGRGRDVILLRGSLIPFVRLKDLFELQEAGERKTEDGNQTKEDGKINGEEHVAVVRSENFRMGIVADRIVGNIQTVIKSLSRNCRQAEGISGATIMGDGTVALILDVPGLIRLANRLNENS